MATGVSTRDMLVHATSIVLEVRVDGEGGLNWATSHKHALDVLHAKSGVCLARVRVLVTRERVVRGQSRRITSSWATRRPLRWAARGALGRVWVIADRTVMVAVGEGETRAPATAESAGAVLVSASDDALSFNVGPRRGDLATVATIVVGVEANVLGRQRHLQGGIRRNAHAVRGSLSTTKSPAAAAIRLITDVVDEVGAGGESLRGVKGGGNGVGLDHSSDLGIWNVLMNLTCLDGLADVNAPVAMNTEERLGRARCLGSEARVGGRLPGRCLGVDIRDLCGTKRVNLLGCVAESESGDHHGCVFW
mmetsp:Transcript_35638/g.76091  ORF Transcript_35638/g.76091 Transcript_35638/m.76091 type:complete len:307 (-) Transcript_35638:14-934(-)